MKGKEFENMTTQALAVMIISIVISLLAIIVNTMDSYKEAEILKIEARENQKVEEGWLEYINTDLYGSELLSLSKKLVTSDLSVVIKQYPQTNVGYTRYLGKPISQIGLTNNVYKANTLTSVPSGITYLGTDTSQLMNPNNANYINIKARYESKLIRETTDGGKIIGVVFIHKP